MKIKVTWRDGAYYVSEPCWDGGDVYEAKEVDELVQASKAAIAAWEVFAGMKPQDDAIESLEWSEMNDLRNAITRLTPADTSGAKP